MTKDSAAINPAATAAAAAAKDDALFEARRVYDVGFGAGGHGDQAALARAAPGPEATTTSSPPAERAPMIGAIGVG